MLYLITQFDLQDTDPHRIMDHGSQLHKMLLQEGCCLLMNSDQLEFSIFSLPRDSRSKIQSICETFKKYCAEVIKVDFQFDFFTWDEIEQSGDFPSDFIQALRSAEGYVSH